METIGNTVVWSLFDDKGDGKPRPAKNSEVRGGPGHTVASYTDLARKIAELQFFNRQHVLLFRGQGGDHRNLQRNTSLQPSLFRSLREKPHQPAPRKVLEERFVRLRAAEDALAEVFDREKLQGHRLIRLHRILRWSILQHYEICATPLLDVSQSARIAASFASDGAGEKAFVYVLAVPNVSGVITASAEAGVQIVRLSGICPPEAVRPHIQEGYLLGEYPDMPDFAQKQHYEAYEIDFGRRLIGKFVFEPKTFWKRSANFPRVTRAALYPDDHDPLLPLVKPLRMS